MTRSRALKPAVYSIPAGRPFLDCLAAALLDGHLPRPMGPRPSPIDLSAITLYLPTRRATRVLEEAFLRVGSARALLLPRIVPISEGNEDQSLITALTAAEARAVSIGPAISEMHRRLALTQLVQRWSDAMRASVIGDGRDMAPVASAGTGTPAQAATLAAELARLMDMVETEDADLGRITNLVPDHHSEHWQKTIEFLKIVTAYWPEYLAERDLISPAGRRSAVIRAEAERLRALPPQGPVIVAGVTGSIPATVELMAAVADLDNGAIILPGLDIGLDDPSWDAIAAGDDKAIGHPEHPQYGFVKLLRALGISRTDVAILEGAASSGPVASREAFLSEAMRPSATTAAWSDYAARLSRSRTLDDALDGLSLIEAPTAQDEAEVVALILREALETPGRTAALVSPDRLLARRVAARLEAWGIDVDDSAGRPLAKTVPGAFLDLLVEAVSEGFTPTATMALLKHPLTRLELDPFRVRVAARALEIAAFRAPYIGSGLAGITAALERARAEVADKERRGLAIRRLFPEDWDAAFDLVARLEAASLPLASLMVRDEPQDLRTLTAAHVSAAELIARTSDGSDGDAEASQLWTGEAGEAAQSFFMEIADEMLPAVTIPPADYPDLYRSLVAGINVRPKVPVHPRLSIWGPFEARLQQTDVTILGSLNDGTWPESADPGPWLNRPMRAELGLPSPEEKLGQAAHDFASLAAGPTVYMTRAEKIDGVPTVPSRWLLRIKALLDGAGAADRLEPAAPWLPWARARDAAPRQPPRSAPEPKPPLSMRPRKMSVSRIETWLANPYAIFAREILALERLSPLGEEPSAALRGSIIHAALAKFSLSYPDHLPDDIRRTLMGMANGILDQYRTHPRIAAFWIPRFERFARWFADTEPARRQGILKIVAETRGALVIPAPGGPFELHARADRIDVSKNGAVITDYKTGAVPKDAAVIAGISPQLPLEAAIARRGAGFANVPPGPVIALRYIHVSGGDEPGRSHDVQCEDMGDLVERTYDGLAGHIARFDDPATPYRPVRRARYSYDYDDYAHLARVAEWSAASENGGGTEA
ncbi:MAG: double-strand break repair protein AddB [Hyphomicrobium sp.]|nr:double-strand break repair protein AddB [Hyphomicrobium sp.]